MDKVKTYLFLDLQATGYPGTAHGEIRITEICLLAVKGVDVEKTRYEPRIQYKFKMCFNPEKKVEEEISQQNGLTLAVLKSETKFNKDVCNAITSFVKCLKKPVCMIAHNAFKFHFPLLKYHMDRMKVAMPDDLLCTDSIYCYYDILKRELYVKPREKSEENCEEESAESKSDPVEIKRDMRDRKYENLVQNVFYEVAPKELYNLSHVYKSVTSGDLKQYDAETNCRMMLKIAIDYKHDFMEWVKRQHCPFSEVPIIPM